jgi:lipopolysaccharide export system protein LptA
MTLLLAGWLVFQALPAAAAPLDSPDSQIEVTADQSLEWYQDKQLYVARGNAKAVRGDVTITADLLTAHQRDQAKTATATASTQPGGNIDQLTADGKVRIVDPRQTITGEKLIYDLDQKLAVLTGGNLSYVTERETVTAKDALEYHEADSMAVARGQAVAIQKDRRVEADVLTAKFAPGANGAQELRQITAEGNVTIITPTDIAKGDRAVYDVARDGAVLTGHVRVTRSDTQLSGDVAEVDFKSGQSRLLNEGKGRVRALLVPREDHKVAN